MKTGVLQQILTGERTIRLTPFFHRWIGEDEKKGAFWNELLSPFYAFEAEPAAFQLILVEYSAA
jgi:hypothetical protein